jgi:cell division protein FtsW
MLRNIHFDISLLVVFLLLIGIGGVFVLSATSVPSYVFNKNPYLYIKKEVIFIFLGLIVMFLAYKTPISFWKKLSYPLTLITIGLLVLVLFHYAELKGTSVRRWLDLGFIRFQPSELAKFTIVLFMANYIARKERILDSWSALIPPILVSGIFIFLIIKEPHNGGAIFIALITLMLLISAKFDIKKLIPFFVLGAIAISLKVSSLEYAKKRIEAFLNPLAHKDTISYQIVQSLLSFIKGGWFGEGLGAGVQKFKYLPEIQTDYIFALIGEEFGVVGCLFIIGLFIYILYKGIKISINLEDTFSKALGVGLTFVITLQALLHFAVNLNIFPATGITLPFISYGGSSLLIMCLIAGILLKLSTEPQEKNYRRKKTIYRL